MRMVRTLLPCTAEIAFAQEVNPEQLGIGGASSSAIAAFTVAWERPNDFRKVISIVGSPVNLRGGHVYPEKARETPKKPIRIFLRDGRNYAWGMNRHGQKMGGAIMPEMMRWLWRDQPVSTDARDAVEKSLRAPATQ